MTLSNTASHPQEESVRILSELTTYLKYARYQPDLERRETWDEIVHRNQAMHLKRFEAIPQIHGEIRYTHDLIREKKILPSMRSLQFAGKPIELAPNRIYNCSFCKMDHPAAFSEIMFLLLGGTGVGYSVQRHHVAKLPAITKPTRTRRYVVGDSIEGWADAVKVLVRSYFEPGRARPVFDFSDVRPKGARLVTSGGKAPGPQPLKTALFFLEAILSAKVDGEKLRPIEVHDMCCHIADAVLAGGIRRAALISLFSKDDVEMMLAKSGAWWELNPQRGRANNSVVMLRGDVGYDEFCRFWGVLRASGAGEPGVLWTNDLEIGTNPCQPGFATVLTPCGLRTFDEIGVGSVIWSQTGWTKVVRKWGTGIKPVYRYVTSAGAFIGTENHRVVCGDEKVEVKDAEGIDCLSGPQSRPYVPHDPQAVMDGLVIGDGTVHKASNNLVLLCVGKKDGDYFEDPSLVPLLKRHRPGITLGHWEIETSVTHEELPRTYEREVPQRYFKGDPVRVASFLRGLFSANGSLAGDRVTLKGSSRRLIDQAQQMLSGIGIRSYVTTNRAHPVQFGNGEYECRESYDLNITADRIAFRDRIGFIQSYKSERLNEICEQKGQTEPRKTQYEIREVEYLGDFEVFDITVDNEPHTYWTGGLNVSNCAEISLRTFCNLTTINAGIVASQVEFNNLARAASFLGTLQAAYTNFHYLRPHWQDWTEEDSLLGVSITGIANKKFLALSAEEAALAALKVNTDTAAMLGIRPAKRITTVKPEGTSSLVLGTSSGIHAWHNDFYLRRLRIGKNEAVYGYLAREVPELVEDDQFNPLGAIVTVPVKAPEGAITRHEPALDLLERVKRFNEEWITPGHREGANQHNVSATISIREGEWDDVREWMWENRQGYTGLSVLPYDGGTYVQAPFEDITEDEYTARLPYLKRLDLSQVNEAEDETNLVGELACHGGACVVT